MSQDNSLTRGIGLKEAIATNVIGMVGIGPFLTIPLMVASMNGPHLIYAWIVGAFLALADGLVYAHLGAALPSSGGPYVYLREAYRPFGIGRFMGFMYIFQIIIVAPLGVAGGAVGFADYLQFLWPTMSASAHNIVAACVCLVMTALLYRNIQDVGRLATFMLWIVLGTIGWVIVSGLFSFSLRQAFDFPAHAWRLDGDLVRRLGATAILAMYSYGGYNQVCNIGEEVKDPTRTIPRSIVWSIVIVATCYILMSVVIVGVLPWTDVMKTKTIASEFIAHTFSSPATGAIASTAMTLLILFVAGASLYAVILGYSRIPFAAAREGDFFKAFAAVHPTKHFPHVSLLTIGFSALPFCFFSLGQIVNWLMQLQILLLFVWQCAAVILLMRYRKDIAQPFVMWLYPMPAVAALVLWLYVFLSGPVEGMIFAVSMIAVSGIAYSLFVRRNPPAPPMES